MSSDGAFIAPRRRQTIVELDEVSVEFDGERGAVVALQNVSLTIEAGDFLTVIGPSGCGKSTLLRVVADLIAPTSGRARLLGEQPKLARERKEIGFVFQEHALLPWCNALANVELPLEVGARRAPPANAMTPSQLLTLVGLADRQDALPHELSGEMRQRVAIARALVTGPRLLLMDEPFGALDEITRDRLDEELVQIWQKTGTTIVFVTHSVSEALFLGRRVLVLAANPGRVLDIATTDLPEPRRLAVRESEPFMRQAAMLRKLLEQCA
ncbi:MAG TPA: ABC transporter ATP-binding protein [Acidobacteriota bacterium]|nr:ABC transporter ATP-binding protein [Acidobacteriota bacterium]